MEDRMNRLEDLREWLTDRIDGSEETRGEDGLVSDFIRQIDSEESATAELADLKQRILPQYLGRAERAEKERQMIAHERDGMLEKLIVQQTTIANLHDVIDGMRDAPSATAATDVEPCCMEWDTCMKRCVPLAENWRMECKRLERLQAPRVEERVPGDHGYDRSASLAEGRYVCTCGACSHYTTKEQPK